MGFLGLAVPWDADRPCRVREHSGPVCNDGGVHVSPTKLKFASSSYAMLQGISEIRFIVG